MKKYPSHKYLVVNLNEVIQAVKNGIKFTRYSFVEENKVYLEAVCDALVFARYKNIPDECIRYVFRSVSVLLYPSINAVLEEMGIKVNEEGGNER